MSAFEHDGKRVLVIDGATGLSGAQTAAQLGITGSFENPIPGLLLGLG